MNLFRKLAFTYWYTGNPPWDTNRVPPELQDFIDSSYPGRALDLGCGTGTNIIALAKHGWDATGIDYIPKAIRTARKKALKSDVSAKFERMDVTKLNKLQGQFDLILDIGCYHSLDCDGMQAYRRNLKDLLKLNGSFLLYTFIDAESNQRRAGLDSEDLNRLLNMMTLIKRVDGEDQTGIKSAWFHLKRIV